MNEKNTFELSGGNDEGIGPKFGPIRAEEVSEIAGEKDYLLLRLSKPIEYKNEKIEFLVVTPHDPEYTLQQMRSQGCKVWIGRVRPGMKDDVLINGVNRKNTTYWATGDCKPDLNVKEEQPQWTSANWLKFLKVALTIFIISASENFIWANQKYDFLATKPKEIIIANAILLIIFLIASFITYNIIVSLDKIRPKDLERLTSTLFVLVTFVSFYVHMSPYKEISFPVIFLIASIIIYFIGSTLAMFTKIKFKYLHLTPLIIFFLAFLILLIPIFNSFESTKTGRANFLGILIFMPILCHDSILSFILSIIVLRRWNPKD